MDGFKELLAAFETRVKSKVVGSIFLAFIVTNWKVLFYIMFEPTNADSKFNYFDAHTSLWTLAVIPILTGVALAATLPWVNFLGLKLTEIADRKQRQFKNNSQHLDALEKSEYEAKAQEFKARRQKAIVESAKASEEAKEIQDPIIRQKTQNELKEIKVDELSSEDNLSSISDSHNMGEKSIDDFSLENCKAQLERLNENLLEAKNARYAILESLKSLEAKNSDDQESFENSFLSSKSNPDDAQVHKMKLLRAEKIDFFNEEHGALKGQLILVDAMIDGIEHQIREIVSEIDNRYDF
jgi:hypothetical protein